MVASLCVVAQEIKKVRKNSMGGQKAAEQQNPPQK
jgi:hypothetical protein